MKSLKIETSENKGVLKITLSGRLDEMAKFHDLSQHTGEIHINTENVSFINSLGIRGWLQWMQTFNTPQLKFERVAVVLIDQLNLVQEFFPKDSEVLSFAVPYFCDECEESFEIFVERKGLTAESAQKSNPQCEHCKKPLEVDTHSEKYFRFLDH